MMLKIFSKKNGKLEEKNISEFIQEDEVSIDVSKIEIPMNDDPIIQHCIEMGMYAKNNVEKVAKGFFNSKNEKKSAAYKKYKAYLATMTEREKRKIMKMDFLEFVEKNEQIFTSFRNGFAQYLSKGARLDDEIKEVIDFVFADIKKLPTKGHKFWYFTIYMWQEELD